MNDSEHNDELLATYAKALGHPARVQIMRYLLNQEECTCSPIVHEIGLAQSTVSQHLKILKEAGLIQGTISGKNTCYCPNQEAIRACLNLLNTLLKGISNECC